MNQVFFGIIALAFGFALLNGTPAEVGAAALDSAKGSIDLAIGLVGYITLFLGLMKIVEEAGGLRFMARMIRPIMVRLFPEIPPDHPAMGAMIMNVSANALGLGNAATPFGLKAMDELNTLNKQEGTATNAMVLFLAINTSGLALLPTGIIGLRQLYGSVDPAVIFPTTLIATACSTVIGIFVAKSLSRIGVFRAPDVQIQADRKQAEDSRESGELKDLLLLLCFGSCLVLLVTMVYLYKEQASAWIMPGLIFGMLAVGVIRKVPVYETFVKGAKEGFSLGVMIMPYLVAILCAVGMLRASGGLDVIVNWIGQATQLIGLPPDVLPLAFLRPLSGSGAYALTADLLQTHGPDSFIGQLASTMNGSTETTFYVLAVYFGAVGVNKTRHAVPAGLAADFTGVIASVFAVRTLLIPLTGETVAAGTGQGAGSTQASSELEEHTTLCDVSLETEGWSTVEGPPATLLINNIDREVHVPLEAHAGVPIRIQACKEAVTGRLELYLYDAEYRELLRSQRTDLGNRLVLEPVLDYEPQVDGPLHLVVVFPELPRKTWAAEVELNVLQRGAAVAR
jgi:spore maturation protein SpmA